MRGIYFPTLLILLLLQSPHAYSQSSESTSGQPGSQKESSFEGLLKKFAEDLLDQATNGSGSNQRRNGPKIASMNVVERGAGYLLADVTFSGVKASELQLIGYATRKGRKVDGISSPAIPLTNQSGTLQIRIARSREGAPEITSDSIFLVIIRGGDKPDVVADRSFKLAKIWSNLEWLDESGPEDLIFADGSPVIEVIQKTPGGKTTGHGTANLQTRTVYTATRLKKTYNHKLISTYKYTATTKNKVKKEGNVLAGHLTWKCRSRSCTISGPWPTPGLSACHSLARIVGRITSYGHPKKKLSAKQLNQCNKGVRS